MRHQIPSDNMAWLSALHLGHYSRCKNNLQHEIWSKICRIFQPIVFCYLGPSILNILWGPGHFGSVVSQENARSKYDPAASKCNFAVPTVNRLRQIEFGYEKKKYPQVLFPSQLKFANPPQKNNLSSVLMEWGSPKVPKVQLMVMLTYGVQKVFQQSIML